MLLNPKSLKHLKVQFGKLLWYGNLSEPMLNAGYNVVSTDLIDRGYGTGNVDFFKCNQALGDNVVTNPPYSMALEWVEHSLDLLSDGKKLALFLPIQFLESAKRKQLFKERPPIRIWVAVNRLLCGINGNFYATNSNGDIIHDKSGCPKRMSSAKCYAWFVWEVGNYNNAPTIGWING